MRTADKELKHFVCAVCGAQTGAEVEQTYQPQQSYDPQQPYQSYDPQQPYQPYTTGQPYDPSAAFSMKWYKFLINFALFASAVLNVISGIRYLTGSVYGDEANLVYGFFSDLKTLDIFYGLAALVFAALAVYTRFQLAGYKKNGPLMVAVLYGVSAAMNLIYTIAAMSILPSEAVSTGSLVGAIIGSGIMLACNYVYFNKRKELFVN